MRQIYFDCFSGISGDMIVGSLLDAGLKIEDLREDLSLLELDGFEIRAEKTSRRHLSATNFFVDAAEHPQPENRGLSQILELLDASRLDADVRDRAGSIFTKLAETEAEIHATTPEQIHFHEVGAVDAIVDVVGTLTGLKRLGIDEAHASPVNVGGGFVECKHGVLPVPAPAAMKLLEGVPIYSRGPQAELVTPTGAVLLTSLVKSYGPIPSQKVLCTGYGAGKSDFPEWPNLLRVIIGEPVEAYAGDEVVVMSTAVDDMNPEHFEYLMELLLSEGALDVYLTPTQAKKTRPGTLVTLLCRPGDESAMASILFSESTTFGIRYRREARLVLDRETVKATTPWGKVKVKIGSSGREPLTISPEFEDCKRVARTNDVPLRRVYDAARAAAMKSLEERT